MDRVANIDMLDEARADSQRYSVAGLIRRLSTSLRLSDSSQQMRVRAWYLIGYTLLCRR